jgi:hypothetical protein
LFILQVLLSIENCPSHSAPLPLTEIDPQAKPIGTGGIRYEGQKNRKTKLIPNAFAAEGPVLVYAPYIGSLLSSTGDK